MNANQWQDRWISANHGLDRAKLLGKDVLERTVEVTSESVFQPLSAKIKASLATGVANVEAAGDRAVAQAQNLVSQDLLSQNILSASIQRWLAMHPLWAWFLAHPLWALAIALVSLTLLVTGLKWLLNPKTWLQILSFPVKFMARRLTPSAQTPLKVSTLGRLDHSRLGHLPSHSPSHVRNHQTVADQLDIQTILARLQCLQQEQAMLHQQLQTLLTEAAKSELSDRHSH
ncbi:MAG: hypothetical protein HC771_14745 [Synechococcales cyanobacterium CRU_2_2]|nr:hypothetical protein [Synechococcales cyanobacterium CRU_2_2]